jgi:hypothetical protein
MPEDGSFDQLSLCRGVNQDFILSDMPQIRYDLVELYWQKMYGSTKPKVTASQDITKKKQKVKTRETTKTVSKKKLKGEKAYHDYLDNDQRDAQRRIDGKRKTDTHKHLKPSMTLTEHDQVDLIGTRKAMVA